jgi:hypothetical protein
VAWVRTEHDTTPGCKLKLMRERQWDGDVMRDAMTPQPGERHELSAGP